MFAIIGATGNVGTATSQALRDAGASVRAVSRNAAKADRLRESGCEIVSADLQDTAALVSAIADVDAVQVIVPLAPMASDPAADMRRSMDSIVQALMQAKPMRILAISDYGAHVDADIGLPSLFHYFEGRLRELGGHKIILRSAEHMHNWARNIPAALASGALPSFQDPVDLAMPTIAAADVGRISADLLLRADDKQDVTIVHAEGPRRYSAQDVADAVGELSSRTVVAQAVPRAVWGEVFANMPPSLADLLIKAGDAKNSGLVDVEPNSGEIRRGDTDLIAALRPFVTPR